MGARVILPWCLLFLVSAGLRAEDSLISQGFDHFYNLEFDQAIADFTTAARQNPDDAARWNHLAQAVLYRAMYRSGALESELVSGSNPFLRRAKVEATADEDRTFLNAINKAIELSQTALEENAEDPTALGPLGIAYGLQANFEFLVHKKWVAALRDATKARKVHSRLCALQPDNVDARLIPGLYDYVAGSLPFGHRLLGFMAGYHGNRQRGIRAVETVARQGKDNRVDAEVLLAAIYRRERHPQEAIPLLEDLISQFPRNYLMRFEVVQMYSDLGNKQAALREVNQIWDLHREGAPGFAQLAPEKIDYLEGNLLFWYNDLDQAVDYLKKAAAKAQNLDMNTGCMSWMRLGQSYDLKGLHGEAVAAYNKVVAMAPDSEVAAESRGYIDKPYRRQQAN